MKKTKQFKDLNKRELVELIHNMIDENGEVVNPPTLDEVNQQLNAIDYKAKFMKVLRSTIAVLIVVAAISVIISVMFLPVIQVSGNSMEPTLSDGDIVLLVKSKSYSAGELCCISWQNKLLLKRVIGKPGDIIDIDIDGNVYVNTIKIDEPYAQNKCLGECDIELPFTVPDGKLFVLGDRRDTSIDSRSSSIGCVDYDQMIGKVLFKVWSSS